jgi:hypothetical protein
MYIYRDIESGYRFGYKIRPGAGVQIGWDDPVSLPKKHYSRLILGDCLTPLNLLPLP